VTAPFEDIAIAQSRLNFTRLGTQMAVRDVAHVEYGSRNPDGLERRA